MSLSTDVDKVAGLARMTSGNRARAAYPYVARDRAEVERIALAIVEKDIKAN